MTLDVRQSQHQKYNTSDNRAYVFTNSCDDTAYASYGIPSNENVSATKYISNTAGKGR
jgi:hypothetical protein